MHMAGLSDLAKPLIATKSAALLLMQVTTLLPPPKRQRLNQAGQSARPALVSMSPAAKSSECNFVCASCAQPKSCYIVLPASGSL